MNCEQGLSLINARMDGELLLDDGHRLTAHLGECANCRVAADELERDDRELARIFGARQRAASTVADQVLEAWFEEAPLPSRRWVHLRWASAAAAGFAMALLLFGPRTWIGSNGGVLVQRFWTPLLRLGLYLVRASSGPKNAVSTVSGALPPTAPVSGSVLLQPEWREFAHESAECLGGQHGGQHG